MTHTPDPINSDPRTANLDAASSPDPRSSVCDPSTGRAPSILDYLEVIARHRRMILSITIVAAIISVVYSALLPNVYTARTLILPAQEDKGLSSAMMAQLGGLAGIAGGTVGGATNADLFVSLMKSDAVKDPIIDRFKLLDVYGKQYRTDTSKKLGMNSVISAGRKDGIITIAVDDTDPKRAAEIANTYVDELGKLVVRLNVSGAGQNRVFLEERLTKAKADLAKAADDLKSFQSLHKTMNLTEQATASIAGIAKLRAELASSEVQLNTLRRTHTETSQEVKNMAMTVAQLRGQVARLEGSGNGGAIPTMGAAPALGEEYLRLMRQFKIQENLVELLAKQYEMTRINEAKDMAPFQIIQRARQPELRSKPARAKIIVSVSIAFFLFSLLLAFAMENYHRMAEKNKLRWRSLLKG